MQNDLAAADVLRRSGQLLDVLTAQLRDVVTTTEEAAFGIVTEVQGLDAATERRDATARALAPTDPEAAARLAGATSALGTHSTSLLALTQFQDVTRQTVEGIVTFLAGLRVQLDAVADHLDEDTPLHLLEDALAALEASYVSDRQRAVHAGVTGGEAPEELAVVELF